MGLDYPDKVRIEVIRAVEELRSLQDDWARLAKNSTENSIYNQPKLLAVWWEHFGGEPQRPFLLKRGINIAGEMCGTESLYVLVAYIENKVVAILPLMLLNVRPQGETRLLKCLTFLGDYVFNPTPNIACLEDIKEAVFNSIAEFLNKSTEWDAIFLALIRQDLKNLRQFLSILKDIIKGKAIHSSLQEVRFLKCWDRKNVVRQLKLLPVFDVKLPEVREVALLTEEIARMAQSEFIKKCLPDITMRLKLALQAYGNKVVKFNKGIISNIIYEISPGVPYMYQIVPLPGRMEEFVATLSKNKKQDLERDKRLCLKEGISIEVENNISEEDFLLFVNYHQERHPHSVHLNEHTLDYYRELLRLWSQDNSLIWIIGRDKKRELVFAALCVHDVFAGSIEGIIYGGKKSTVNFVDNATMLAVGKSIELKCRYFSFRMGAELYKSAFHPVGIPLACCVLSREPGVDLIKMLPNQWVVAG